MITSNLKKAKTILSRGFKTLGDMGYFKEKEIQDRIVQFFKKNYLNDNLRVEKGVALPKKIKEYINSGKKMFLSFGSDDYMAKLEFFSGSGNPTFEIDRAIVWVVTEENKDNPNLSKQEIFSCHGRIDIKDWKKNKFTFILTGVYQ